MAGGKSVSGDEIRPGSKAGIPLDCRNEWSVDTGINGLSEPEYALRRKLEQAGQKMKYSVMMEDLKSLLAVQLIHEGKTYLTRPQLTGRAYDVFKALRMRPPNHMQVVTR